MARKGGSQTTIGRFPINCDACSAFLTPSRSTYSIWRGADPTNIVGFREPANDYFIQAAGSADAMTVEVRLPGPDGEGHLYTVGRPESADGTTTLIPISDRRAVRVSSTRSSPPMKPR